MAIVWRKEMSVANEMIDTDHKQLIGVINEIEDALQKGNESQELFILIENLRTYTVDHFDREERYMKSIQFPYAMRDPHKKEHINLVSRLNDISAGINNLRGKEAFQEAIPKLVEMLRDWLLHHILQEDMKIKRFVAQKIKVKA